jgi:hypothetical protein
MQNFKDKNSKNKYFYKIFDLDNNDLDVLIEEAINEIDTWSGEKYCPDLYINICCNDEIILPSRVLNGLKNGINEICRSSYALITTSINIFFTFNKILIISYLSRWSKQRYY